MYWRFQLKTVDKQIEQFANISQESKITKDNLIVILSHTHKNLSFIYCISLLSFCFSHFCSHTFFDIHFDYLYFKFHAYAVLFHRLDTLFVVQPSGKKQPLSRQPSAISKA